MKAPRSEEVKEIERAGKGHELVRVARKGGGTVKCNDKTYRVVPASENKSKD